MGKFTPLFKRDGDTYVVPASQLQFDDAAAAIAAGAGAGLADGYGLVATGEAVELTEEGSYPGPFLISAIGNIRAWIVDGETLTKLVEGRHDAVENLPLVPDTAVVTAGTTSATIASGETAGATATVTSPGDHVGPEI